MNRPLVAVLVALAVGTLFFGSVAVAAQPVTGFATYKISVTTPMGAHSVTVNETVKGSDRAGFSDVILQLIGTSQNLTYSRLVNSSKVILPFLPAIPSQAFDYSNKSLSVHANLTQGSPVNVSFQGGSYTMTVYDVSLSGTYGNRSFSAFGTVDTFPSTLVYSASLSSGLLAQVTVVLQKTDLQLNQGSSSMATAAVAGAGIGAVGIAAAATFFVRRKDRRAKAQGQKPLHWVD